MIKQIEHNHSTGTRKRRRGGDSTKLTATVPQRPIRLKIEILRPDDETLPVSRGAALNGHRASAAEVEKKERQLALTRAAGGLIDLHSEPRRPTRAHIHCIYCKRLVNECICEKPAADDGLDNTAPADERKPFERNRRRQREFMRGRRRLLRPMEGGGS
jgi:hypothetical protein